MSGPCRSLRRCFMSFRESISFYDQIYENFFEEVALMTFESRQHVFSNPVKYDHTPIHSIMKTISKIFAATLILFALSSCEDLEKKVEEKLDILNEKAAKIDSLVNRELEKVDALDSIINKETEKIQKLDSLIDNSSSRVDSLVNGKLERINSILN